MASFGKAFFVFLWGAGAGGHGGGALMVRDPGAFGAGSDVCKRGFALSGVFFNCWTQVFISLFQSAFKGD